MHKVMLVLMAALCAAMIGCGASSVNELKSNPGHSKSVTSKYGYQESLKIIKDEYASLLGYDLSCTVFSDMKMGECTFTAMFGIAFVATSKYIDDNSSKVDFYTAQYTRPWDKTINHLAAKLQ